VAFTTSAWSRDIDGDARQATAHGMVIELDGREMRGAWMYLSGPASGVRTELLDVRIRAGYERLWGLTDAGPVLQGRVSRRRSSVEFDRRGPSARLRT
jgi:hypothetical protein